jgi:WD40 repeat protein
MQKSELKFKKLILKLTNSDGSFFNKFRWKKVLTLLGDDPALGVFLAPIASNSENIYSVKAQDIIARAWWNSIGEVEENERYSLLVATSSHAEAGYLRIYTHVIHKDLEVLLTSLDTFDTKNSFKESPAIKLLGELNEAISLGDNWALELIKQIGAIAATKKFGDLLPDLLWKYYFDESKYADEIRFICAQNSILPSAGDHYFTSAAILGPAFFRRLITDTNVHSAYSEVSRCLEKFYSSTVYSENRRVGSESLKKSLSDLIEHAEGEILEYFWDRWYRKPNLFVDASLFDSLEKNNSLPSLKWIDHIWEFWRRKELSMGSGSLNFSETAEKYEELLKRWAIPYSKSHSSDHRRLRAESIGFLKLTSMLDDENPSLTLESLQYICSSDLSQVRLNAKDFICHKSLVKTREEMFRQALVNANVKKLCIEFKVAPIDEIQRSVFFLVTSQIDELKLLDSDLDLLGIAYLSGDDNQRGLIRTHLLKEPNLSLAQVISGFNRRDRLARMTVDEVEYFINALLARNDFDGILEIAVNMSLAVFLWSVVHIRRTSKSWSPSDPELAQVFRKANEWISRWPSLNAVRDRSNSVLEALQKIVNWPIGVPSAKILFDGRINDIAFSPDGKFIAVAGTNKVVGEVDLTAGKLSFVERGFHSSVGNLLHLGNHSILAAERTNSPEKLCRVISINKEKQGKEIVSILTGSVTSLVKFGETGAVYTGRNGALGLISLKGKPREVKAIKVGNDYPRLAAENSNALHGVFLNKDARYFTYSGDQIRLHNSVHLESVAKRATWVTTKKSEKIVYLTHSGVIKVLHVDSKNQSISRGRAQTSTTVATDMVLLPNRNQIAVLSDYSFALISSDDLKLIDQGEIGMGGKSLHGSPDGTLIAIGDENGVLQLIDTSTSLVPALFNQPIALLTPKDFQSCMRAANSILNKSGGDYTAMQLLLALQIMLLQHRFRHDISLVDPTKIKMGEYDISLS